MHAKPHRGICFPLIHSIVSNESVSGQRWLWSDCAYAQADLGHRYPHLPEDTFSHEEAKITVSLFVHKIIYCAWALESPLQYVSYDYPRHIYELQRQKAYLLTYVPSEDSDQPAHSRSLNRLFTRHILDSQGSKVSSCIQRILVRLHACAGCFVSPFGRTYQKARWCILVKEMRWMMSLLLILNTLYVAALIMFRVSDGIWIVKPLGLRVLIEWDSTSCRKLTLIHGPRHAKACLRAYANSEGPDQPAHPHSLIRAFAVR